MTDYIKREDAIEIIASHDDTDGTIKVFSGRFVNGLISAIPIADVVEVVRCKDCKWRDIEPKYNVFLSNGCRWHEAESPDDDDFCSYGERGES